jgi:hypothetical protein
MAHSTETQTEFARRIGRDKSYVTRLKQRGRLVMDDRGRVVVDASLERIEATRGARHDVEARWRDARSGDAPASGDGDMPSVDEIGRRTRYAQMRKEEAEAAKRERELKVLDGTLVERKAVQKAVSDAAAVIVGYAENIPDRLAPQLTDIDRIDRVRAILKDEMSSFLEAVSAAVQQKSEDQK